jgi:hypothetical protein
MSNENAVIAALADELAGLAADLHEGRVPEDPAAADKMEGLYGRLARAASASGNANAIASVQRAGEALRVICRSLRADVA